MDQPLETALVDPEDTPSGNDPEREQELATQAFDGINVSEKLSGFGRFAARLQSFFRGSGGQQGTKSAHFGIAPVMMTGGVLLLIATGAIFLLSKPESAVPKHFHEVTDLSGADTPRRAGPSSDNVHQVTESQLAGGDAATDVEGNAPRLGNSRRSRAAAGSGRLGGGGEKSRGNQNDLAALASNELQTPATVFIVAHPVPASASVNAPALVRPTQLQLPVGTEIIAHTTNAITSGLESPVIAVVDRNVKLNDGIVIPEGARVIGYTAGILKDRINVRFTSVLLPGHRGIAISGLGLMKDGSAGLAGKVQGSGHPILSVAARIGTGAATVATEFAGQRSFNQPFSQADYLRNQMAGEVATEGNRLSSRVQPSASVPIVRVETNQPLRIFLLSAMDLGNGQNPHSESAPTLALNTGTAESAASEPSLATAEASYIQALEAQLADMRSALNQRQANGQR